MTGKQKRLLALATAFDNACRSTGVAYSLACGTLLGCIREKGFIPWDDDFDIMMGIDAYRILNARHHLFSDSFTWLSYPENLHSPVVYARVYETDVDLHCLERFPYLDIHVFVPAADSAAQRKRDLFCADLLYKCFWFRQRKYHRVFSRLKSFLGALVQLPLLLVPPKAWACNLKRFETKYSRGTTAFSMPLQGYYGEKEVFPTEWLSNCEERSFEGKRFSVLTRYDDYLHQIYGDYSVPVKYHH